MNDLTEVSGIVPVGAVPDEVLLVCGRPGSAPSAWWTPSLVGLDRHGAQEAVATARTALEEVGVHDPGTGDLSGLLGEVAAVVARARVVVLLETTRGRHPPERRSVVVAEDRAVLDLHDPTVGSHDLLLAGPASTVALLAGFLAPAAFDAIADVRRLAGRRSPDEVAQRLPEPERTATTRITRTSVARGRDPGGVHMVTVVEHPAATVACWALPGGDVQVEVLDGDAVVDLALALLGAGSREVAV